MWAHLGGLFSLKSLQIRFESIDFVILCGYLPILYNGLSYHSGLLVTLSNTAVDNVHQTSCLFLVVKSSSHLVFVVCDCCDYFAAGSKFVEDLVDILFVIRSCVSLPIPCHSQAVVLQLHILFNVIDIDVLE